MLLLKTNPVLQGWWITWRKINLVKRVASKDDRRINLIFLTPEAQTLQEKSMDLANQTLNEALKGVTNGQVEIAKEVLQMVYENLK